MEDISDKIELLKDALESADAVVIGAGSGLSTSAGFTYSGKRFHENFNDFASKYGFTDMYSGGFTDFDSLEENWAYWSRYIFINRYCDPPKDVYKKLLNLICGKNYFVLTTNVDHCFQKAGFDKSRLFYTQGDYGLFQCSVPCCKKTWDNEEQVMEMYRTQKDLRIPSNLIPRCPVCGKLMTMNLRADDTFVQDEGWYKAAERYDSFIEENKHKKVLFLELGVGGNTPGIIKYPFWNMVYRNKKAVYACVNFDAAVAPDEIKNRSILIKGDIGEVLEEL